jgi:cystathionine beta-synthase
VTSWRERGVVFHDSPLELIGGTPLVRLSRVTAGLSATVLAKVETFNPGGSVKDRIAVRMIDAAEAAGTLRPGGTIVEPTSGNTGVGLAMVAQLRGYRCVFTCPDKVSRDKIDVLRAYGAEVVVCPAAVPIDHPDSYRATSGRLAAEIPGAVKLDQYANLENPASHYHGTGPELWEQTAGLLTHFVAGIGTGGTISGTGRYLKEVSGGRVTVVGADPDGSVYSGGTGRPYLLEGVGQPSFPRSFDAQVPDSVLAVSDHESIEVTRRLAREEGLLVGGSSGMAVAAALRVARHLGPEALVAVLLPDSGRGYLSKIFNTDWLHQFGFGSRGGEPVVAEVAEPLCHLTPEDPVRTAVKLMRESRLPGLPVARAEQPLRAAEIAGVVSAQEIAEALLEGRCDPGTPVGELSLAAPVFVGVHTPLTAASRAVRGSDLGVVLDGGLVHGLITVQNLLPPWEHGKEEPG